jgi:hypothetical protein
MAWQGNVGKHQYRKEASSALRSGETRAALADAADPDPTKPQKVKREKKTLGLRFYWRSIFQGRETSQISWYATEEDRAKAKAHGEKELNHNRKPRFTRIEECER